MVLRIVRARARIPRSRDEDFKQADLPSPGLVWLSYFPSILTRCHCDDSEIRRRTRES